MRPQEISLTDAETESDPLFPDSQQVAFELGLQVDFLDAADGTAAVQATMRDPRDPDFLAAEWLNVTDLDALTGAAQGNIVIPCFAVRLTRAGGTTGSVRLTMLQTRNN